MSNPVLEVQEICKIFPGVVANQDVSLSLHSGEILALLGENGAGKSTLFNLIAGNLNPESGSIYLDGEDVTGLKPHVLFSKGLLRTFQIAHEFQSLSVLDNLMMVPSLQVGESLLGAWFKREKVVRQEAEMRGKAEEVISFLNMGHLANELAGNLSGGQKKLLELGRTMMVSPKVVILDEVGAGVNRTLLKEIGDAILSMNRERGFTFCMIEHDMDFISRLCDPVVVMAEGKILAQGSAEEIKANEDVIEAYLGTSMKNMGEALPG